MLNGTNSTDMKQLFASMEETMKLRYRASAERRAREAEQEQKNFREKLMRAAASENELDGMASKAKGRQDATVRDQLAIMMMAGF